MNMTKGASSLKPPLKPAAKRKAAEDHLPPAKRAATGSGGADITQDEVALYDRQIRLWGMDAQKRMRDSNVLIAGLKGINNEVVKNIVLAGIGRVTVIDGKSVSKEDLAAQFLLREEDVGSNRAIAVSAKILSLNPRVELQVVSESVDAQPDAFFEKFDVIVANGLPLKSLHRLNNLCHAQNIKFFSADNFGKCGYIFADLGHHNYVQETKFKQDKDAPEEAKRVELSLDYVSLKDSFNFRLKETSVKLLKRLWSPLFFVVKAVFEFQERTGKLPGYNKAADFQTLKKILDDILKENHVPPSFVSADLIKSVANTVECEMSPVCAILGGILAQEVIKVVSGKDLPIKNWFVFNAEDMSGVVCNASAAS